MNKVRKRLFSMALALVMLLVLVPYTAVPARAAGPVITLQPKDQYAYSNTQSVAFSVEAQGKGLKFQWYVIDGKDGVTTATQPRPYYLLGHVKSTENRSTMILEMYAGVNWSNAGTKVYCEVTDSDGKTTTSSQATAHIRPMLLKDEPADVYAAEGTECTLPCYFTGVDLTFQWYILRPGKIRYEPVEGTLGKSQSYPFTMSEDYNTARMYCVATDRWGNTTRSRTALIQMTAPMRTNSIHMTFPAPALDGKLGVPEVTTEDETFTVKNVTAWKSVDGYTYSYFQRGLCYSFEATLVPKNGYRFDNPVGISAVSSDGFSGATVLKALSPKEIRVEVKYYAGLKFMYYPQDALWAQAAGQEVQACAKAYANNGKLYYRLYKENGTFVEGNTSGAFNIAAQTTAQGYYIEAADLLDGTVATTKTFKGKVFQVGVKAKKELVITKEPDDIGLNDVGLYESHGIDMTADGEYPLTYALYDAETDELVDAGETTLFAPADREGSYYVVVTDADKNTVKSRTFKVYHLQRNPIDEVRIYVEEPVGGAKAKIVFLDENEEIISLKDDNGAFDYPEYALYQMTYYGLFGDDKVIEVFETGKDYRMEFNFSVRDAYYKLEDGADAGTAWRFTENTKFYVNGKEAKVSYVSSHNAGVSIKFTALDPATVPQKLEELRFTFTEPLDGQDNTPPDVAVTVDGAELIGEASDLYWERESYAYMTHVAYIANFAHFHAAETYRFTATFRAKDGYRFSKGTEAYAVGKVSGENYCLNYNLAEGVLTVTARYTLPAPTPYSSKGSTLFFESNGGTPVDPITAEPGTTVSEPTMPIRRDHRFAGWFRDEELQERFRFEDEIMPKLDTTLYAKWIENEVEILRLTVNGSEDLTNIEGGNMSFQADVKMSEEEFNSVWVVVACYNADGQMLHLSSMQGKKNSDGTYTFTAKIKEPREVARVSILILNKEEGVPISDLFSLVNFTAPED